MANNKNVFGLDIGIASVGTAVSDGKDLLYFGSHVFNVAEEAKEPRKNRSARRNTARKRWRKEQLLDAFSDFNVLKVDKEARKNGFLCFTTNTAEIQKPKDYTVYHLRYRAISEKVTKRELLLCIYSLLHSRGNFLYENIDFINGKSLDFEEFKRVFYEAIDDYSLISESERTVFEKEILVHIYHRDYSKKDITNALKNTSCIVGKEEKKLLEAVLLLICNFKVKLSSEGDALKIGDTSINITSLKSSEKAISEFEQRMIELYDIINIAKFLDKYEYLCQEAIDKIDEFTNIIRDQSSKEFEDLKARIAGSSGSKNHLRCLRNFDNNYPNGLYIREARAILKNQQKYYPEITDEFIDVCETIISARIPYYIGPLSDNSKWAWAQEKKGNFKYSYAYSMEHNLVPPLNEIESIKVWKERMISRCTYLPEEFALPKGSFVGEIYSILNELNVLKAIDTTNDDYYLTYKDKVKIIDSLFLNGDEVQYYQVRDLIHLQSFGTRKNSDGQQKFKNKLTLYPKIVRILPELKLSSISEILNDTDKVKEIEDIILSMNIYSEKQSRKKFFENKYNNDVIAKSLAELSSNKFYSFSYKFIMEQSMDENGSSLLSLLFEENSPEYVNEQMYLIANAHDKNGEILDFSANKYEKILRDNHGVLNIDLLIQNSHTVLPISRPVIRGLNETMKLYTELINIYGVPEKVIIETAKDLKDHSVVQSQSVKHFDKMKSLYDYLKTQLKNKYKKYQKYSSLEDWKDIESYLAKNKQKVELYIRQNGQDLLTGKAIEIAHLEDYEIDHILPYGFGDDSMDDKMLILKKVNAKKSNRTPLEFIESGDTVSGVTLKTSGQFIQTVELLYDLKLISDRKRSILLLGNTKEVQGFINQNLVDTRYIIREFMSILNAYNKYHNYNTHVVCMRSAFTSMYRRAFRLEKNRDFGEQHHAHDAALLIVADKTLSQYYPNYDRRRPGEGGMNKTYSDFIQQMLSDDKAKKNALQYFIYGMFRQAYGLSYADSESIISQIKRMTPFYSNKVEKNYKGEYFKANPLKQKRYSDTAVLSILGINNEKHVYTGVECVATDFYKISEGKTIKKHVAISIPKIIIDSEGHINKEKYIALIKYHYKVTELLDENDNLKMQYFRFRAFKNDIIYDTEKKCPVIFLGGSITRKSIELSNISIFSYNNIYTFGDVVRKKLIDVFNLKSKFNPEGEEFKKDAKKNYLDYVNRMLNWHLDNQKLSRVFNQLKNDNTIYTFSNHIALIDLLLRQKITIFENNDGRIRFSATEHLKMYKDAQYVKLKYSILGLRFIQLPNGGLSIVSPKEKPGTFSKITKEEFSWNICKEDL